MKDFPVSTIGTCLDSHILSQALEAMPVSDHYQASAQLHWLIGTKISTRTATLFPLSLSLESGAAVTAYYKRFHERHRPVAAGVIERTQRMNKELAALCGGEGVVVPKVLAASPKALTIVTSVVPGIQFRTILKPRPFGQSTQLAVDACRRVGRAVRLIENVAYPGEVASDHGQWPRIESALERARGLLRREDWLCLYDVLTRSFETSSSESLAFAHGDLSPSNVLISNGSIGLVDFQWQVRLPGYDLATFAGRLANRWTSPGRVQRLVDALCEGYGDRGVSSSQMWVYHTLLRTLHLASKDPDGQPRGGSRGISRARASLRSQVQALRAAPSESPSGRRD